jgi:hypothetical protein
MLLQRVKPLERLLAETKDESHSLKKTLGPVSLIAMGIGAIIGTGIFVLTGVASARYSGPSLTVSFVIAGVVSAFAALCYSEVASRVPIAGSAYTFAYASLGEFVAWIIGWDLVLEYALGAATVSVGWSGYFFTVVKNITGFSIPDSLMHNPWDLGPMGQPVHGFMNLPAFCIICLIGFLLYRGTRESAVVNNVIVTIKVCVVLFFIAVGVSHVNTANWIPYFPYGLGGTMFGAFFVFFAYIGFDAVSTAAEESVNPKRDMPIGIIGSLAICTVLYIIGNPDWDRSVQPPQRAAAGRICNRSGRSSVGGCADRTRRDCRSHDRAAGDDVRADARVLCNVTRWIVTEILLEGSSDLPDTERDDDRIYDLHRPRRRVYADHRPRRADEYGNALCVHPRCDLASNPAQALSIDDWIRGPRRPLRRSGDLGCACLCADAGAVLCATARKAGTLQH